MRFNPDQYDPKNDSSEGRGKPGEVQLVVANSDGPLCMSGIGKPVSKGRKFSQGGDAKLKGILMRAHATGTKVTLLGLEGGAKTSTAMALAKQLGWSDYLTRFEGAVKAKTEARKVAATKRAAATKKAAAKKATTKKAAGGRKRAAKKATSAAEAVAAANDES